MPSVRFRFLLAEGVGFELECYTISAVDKSPKIWYNKEQGTRKEGKEDGTL